MELFNFLQLDRGEIESFATTPSAHCNAAIKKLGSLFAACDWKRLLHHSETLLDYSWEKLNTGHWKEVDIAWRRLYSLSSLCNIIGILSSNHATDKQVLRKALKHCDMGLLMGAPILNDTLCTLGTRLHAAFVGSDQSNPYRVEPLAAITSSPPEKRKRNIMGGKEIPRKEVPSLISFLNENLTLKSPVVLTGVLESWPAYQKWNVEYMRRIAGERTVPVEVGSKYTEESWSQQLMTINEFCHRFMHNKKGDVPGYLAQHQLFDQIEDLKRDIVLPDYCSLLSEEEDVDINGWFGPAGTVSPLHQDPRDNLLAQIFGSKLVRLCDVKQTENVYPHSEGMMTNTSQVDVENPDLKRFPKFEEAELMDTVLEPGELLYIPKQWWHYLRSLEPSFSVSFWFGE